MLCACVVDPVAGPSPIINFFEYAHNAFTFYTTLRVLHFSAIHISAALTVSHITKLEWR